MMHPSDLVASLLKMIGEDDVVLFLGGVDVGKTTLIKSIHSQIGGEVVDADVGQSSIGPPTCISCGTYQKVRASYFVGDISPRGNFIQVLTGVKKMVSLAKRPCLIDTDGYISGGAAKAFKGEMINLISPDIIVLLQRGHELDYFKLFAQKGIDVVDIAVSHSGLKTRQRRICAREEAFRRYFQDAILKRWSLDEVRFERSPIGHGESIDQKTLEKMLSCRVVGAWHAGEEATVIVDGLFRFLGEVKLALGVEYINIINLSSIRNLLLGCLKEGELQGLGILKDINPPTVEVLTPVEWASVLMAGSILVNDDGSHRTAES
jgi:polynucleotide 5'-hydroxyl-kinase GRC3/NOL9